HTALTQIYTLSLHDALPISTWLHRSAGGYRGRLRPQRRLFALYRGARSVPVTLEQIAHGRCWPLSLLVSSEPTLLRHDRHNFGRSEEHTSELQSRGHLVCRL